MVNPKQLKMSSPLDQHQIHPSMLNRSSGKSAASGRILQIEFSNFSLVSLQDDSCGSLGSKMSTDLRKFEKSDLSASSAAATAEY